MPTVLEWNPTVDPSEYLESVRVALADGVPVILPGDCGYVVLVNPARSVGVPLERPAVLASGPDDAIRLGVNVPLIARRLMIRAWPAPLTIALPETGAPSDWAESYAAGLLQDGCLRFRCPDHPIFDTVAPAVGGSTLIVETNQPTAAAVLESWPDAVAIAAGELRTDRRPTLVKVTVDGWTVLEPGAFALDEIEKLAARIVLFVCTGNTCRSPLAEGLAKKALADRLGCGANELPARGFWLLSAGVAAFAGGPASPDSIDVAAEFGADLLAHRSRPVNPQLLAAADDVIAMTRYHAQAIATWQPGGGPDVKLLCDDGDLDDPIGAGPDVYRACARTILRHLERFISEWVRP